MRIFGILPALFVNLAVVAAVIVAVWLLKDGTPLLGLLAIQPMQSGVVPDAEGQLAALLEQQEEEDEGQFVGFIDTNDKN